MPSSTANKTPVQLRMPNDLHQRIKAYAADRKISLSDALRRLLYTGLRADIDDPTDISRALANVRSDIHDHTADLNEIHAALEDVKGALEQQHEVLQAVSQFTELVGDHGEPMLRIICELLVISRAGLAEKGEKSYAALNDLFPQQYEVLRAYVSSRANRRGADLGSSTRRC